MDYKIAVLPGDGTGPEVVAEGLKVLEAAAARQGFGVSTTDYDFGGERYMRTGETLPDSASRSSGSTTPSSWAPSATRTSPRASWSRASCSRPASPWTSTSTCVRCKLIPGVETPIKNKGPKDIDYVCIRENTGGMYTGMGGNSRPGTKDEVAIQEMVYTYDQVAALPALRLRVHPQVRQEIPGRGPEQHPGSHREDRTCSPTCTSCGTECSPRWATDYPDVKREYYHVDATCLYMVASPEMFDVMVVENMFGDIVTDLGAITQGGLGVAAGGNINPEGVSMFEPIGGSAPPWTGQERHQPAGRHRRRADDAGTPGRDRGGFARSSRGSSYAVSKMKSMAAGEMGMGTDAVGDLVAEYVARHRDRKEAA